MNTTDRTPLVSLHLLTSAHANEGGALPVVPPPLPVAPPREYTEALEREVSPLFGSALTNMVTLARRLARRHGQFQDPEGLVVGGVVLGLIERYMRAHRMHGLSVEEAGEQVAAFFSGLLSASVRRHLEIEAAQAPKVEEQGTVTP